MSAARRPRLWRAPRRTARGAQRGKQCAAVILLTFLVTMIVPMTFLIKDLFAPPATLMLAICGIAETILLLGGGFILMRSLLYSADNQLFATTPLTPGMLMRRRLLKNAHVIVPVLLGVGFLLFIVTVVPREGLAVNRLFVPNQLLAMTALLVYPFLTESMPHRKYWDWFVPLRRLIAGWKSVRVPQRMILPIVLAAMAGCIFGFAWIIQNVPDVGGFLNEHFARIMRSGPAPRLGLAVLAPMWGVYYVHMPEAAPWEAKALTILLVAINWAALYQLVDYFRVNMARRDEASHDAWLRWREAIEQSGFIRQTMAEAAQAKAHQRRIAEAAEDGLVFEAEAGEADPAEVEIDAAAPEAAQTDPAAPEPAPWASERARHDPDAAAEAMHESEEAHPLPYETDLGYLEQLERHREKWKASWSPLRKPLRFPWQILFVVAWIGFNGLNSLNRIDSSQLHTARFAVAVAVLLLYPIGLGMYQRSRLATLLTFACYLPSQWPPLMRRLVWRRSWKVLLWEALASGALTFGLGLGWIGLVPAALTVELLAVLVPLLVWVGMLSICGRRAARNAVLLPGIAAEACALGLAVASLLGDMQWVVVLLLGCNVGLLAMLVIFALYLRLDRRSDMQIVLAHNQRF